MKAFKLFSCILLIVAIDFFLKKYVQANLFPMNISAPFYPYGGIPVWKDWHGIDFAITYATNKGTAWGFLSELGIYLVYLRVAIIGGLISYLVFVKKPFFIQFALALVLAGACGNVIDFFVYGHVIDMFYFKFWGYSYPVFNVADTAIFCGVVLLLFSSLCKKQQRSSA